MNDPEPLLHDVLSAGGNSAESESLAHLLQAVRRTRRARKMTRSGGGLAVVLVGVVSAFLATHHPDHSLDGSHTPTASGPVVAPQLPPAAPIKSISDEELFALFPGRQLALIGPPGDQRLVILDQK